MIPESVDDAHNELAVIDSWLQDYHQRVAMRPQYEQRAAFLNGYIAAKSQSDEPDDSDLIEVSFDQPKSPEKA